MRTEYLLPCDCGKKLVVESTQAGQTVRCSCGRQIDVPTMQGLRRLEIVAQDSSTTRIPRSWNPLAAAMLVGVVLMASGAVSTYLTYKHRPQLMDIDQITPWESFVMWQDLRTGARLPEFSEVPYLEARRLYLQKLWISSALTGIGGVVTAVSISVYLVQKRRGAQPSNQEEPGNTGRLSE